MKTILRLWVPMLIAIIGAYLFVDRPLCQYIYDHAWPQYLCSVCMLGHWPFVHDNVPGNGISIIKLLVEWPPIMTGLAPLLILGALFLPPCRPKQLLIFMGITILVTFVLKNDLKWIFSRDWPLTWTHNNPSWISNHAYGFLWFRGGLFQGTDETGSFPSGHTAVAFAALMPIGFVYRKAMPYLIPVAVSVGLGMIAFDYHFLSDVLAGALVGVTCTLAVESILGTALVDSEEVFADPLFKKGS